MSQKREKEQERLSEHFFIQKKKEKKKKKRCRGSVTPRGKNVNFNACLVNIFRFVGKFETHWSGP